MLKLLYNRERKRTSKNLLKLQKNAETVFVTASAFVRYSQKRSDLLAVFKFADDFLNTIRRIQQSADGGIVIQLVDNQCDIFAQVAADVVLAGI